MDEERQLPSSWNPQSEGAEIAGFILAREECPSQYEAGKIVTVLVIDPANDRPRSVWCSARDLREFAEWSDPQPGEFVTITYEGATRLPSGYTRKNYTTSIMRGSNSPE